MHDYLKCVWWNKFVLFGWVCVILGSSVIAYTLARELEEGLVFVSAYYAVLLGVIALVLTDGGCDTLGTYRRVKEALQSNKRAGVERMARDGAYCDKVAAQAALREE
jgi:hypothetical protein